MTTDDQPASRTVLAISYAHDLSARQVRAIIEAAEQCLSVFTETPGHWAPLAEALAAYRATQDTPPTHTGYLGYYDDSPSPSVFLSIPQAADRVWRCHIIPVERVR